MSKTLESAQSDLKEVNNKIDNAENQMRTLVNKIASRNKNFGIVAVVVPFIGFLINAAQKLIIDPGDKAAIDLAKTKMSQLQEEKTHLSSRSGRPNRS